MLSWGTFDMISAFASAAYGRVVKTMGIVAITLLGKGLSVDGCYMEDSMGMIRRMLLRSRFVTVNEDSRIEEFQGGIQTV